MCCIMLDRERDTQNKGLDNTGAKTAERDESQRETPQTFVLEHDLMY